MMNTAPKNQEFKVNFAPPPGIRKEMRELLRLWNQCLAETGWKESTLSLRIYGNVFFLEKMRSGVIQLRTVPTLKTRMRNLIAESKSEKKAEARNERKPIQL